MNKAKITINQIFEMLIDLFANVFLWILIWAGAVISFANHDETFLGSLLFLSGVAWVYKDYLNKKKGVKK